MAVTIDNTNLIDKNSEKYKKWLEEVSKKTCVLNDSNLENLYNFDEVNKNKALSLRKRRNRRKY